MATTLGPTDLKTVLHRQLQRGRDALVWKTEGLGERALRLPRTPTGTNLLGLVKHCASVEIGYLGLTFGRPWPDMAEVPWLAAWSLDDPAADPQADWYATPEEPAEHVLDLYRRAWAFADATIAELLLDAPGRVPWWGEGRRDTTLAVVLVHVLADVQRHAGHADILREGADGAVGLSRAADNMPGWEEQERAAYVERLRAIAEAFGD
ncbi:DinB family protein [Puerhibacterium sp. TATVAM-FAB25]|uniref:DinB family protein n=1 Tax=Puerhibacterium sp. TATVAM-FAB25 TaxID=3093699 RepID=UPI00397C76DD